MENKNIDYINIVPQSDVIRIEHSERQIHEWNDRDYSLGSIDSVIKLVKAKGSIDKTIIFYNNGSSERATIQVIFDDTIQDRPLDTATYNFEYSNDLREWINILGKPLTQKSAIDFLKIRPANEIKNVDSLIASLQQMKLVTEIVGEYQYDDNNNISFFFKTKDGEGCAKIPSEIVIQLPVLNESEYKPEIDIEIELNKPKTENEKPTIVFKCPKLNRYVQDAINFEIEKMKKALRGYLIINGYAKLY